MVAIAMTQKKNPSKQVYKATAEYILSNAEIAKTFKTVNITRYDAPTHNKFPFKQELAPADLPDFVLQLTGAVPNRQSSCEYVEIYNFQATITTNGWTLDQASIAHELMDWLIDSNYNMMNGIDFGEGYNFFKCEVMAMQSANHMPERNRNLSGFVYAILFNIQVSRMRS
jgi:hypothetical protein